MTPYELQVYAEVREEQIQHETEEKITMVWLGEYYHRTKRLPSIKSELKRFFKDAKAMSDEEMYYMAMKLNAEFGGSVT